MAKPGRKPKSFMAPRYNPYAHRIRASQASAAPVFQNVSTNYLEIAKGEDVESDGGDSDYPNETRRRSWTREQKLGAVHYASLTYITSKDGKTKLIARNAAAKNIGCTPKMLRDWFKDYDKIKASSKGSRRTDCTQPAQEPEMESQLYDLFMEKRSIGRRVGRRWLERHAKIIYGNLYPHRAIRVEGELTTYEGFRFSDGWFHGFKKRFNIALRVSNHILLRITTN